MIRTIVARHRKVLLGAVLLVGLYALIGFLVLPGLVRPRLQDFLVQKTGRTVRLGALATNPFSLSVTLNDLVIGDRDTSTCIGFRELYVNYDITSLVSGEYRFDAIRMEDPFIAVRIMRNGDLSLQDLIDSTMSGPETSADTGASRPLVVADLDIRHGTVLFEDRSRPTPFAMRIDSLSLSLRDFTTRPDESGAYSIAAYTQKEEYLAWRGRIGVRPFQSSGEVELRGLRARTLWEYLQDRVKYEVASGTMDMQAKYDYRVSGDSSQLRIMDGGLAAHDVRILDRADTSVLIALPDARLTGLSLALPEQVVRISSLKGISTELLFSIHRDSSINWVSAFATGTAYADSVNRRTHTRQVTGPPWSIRIDRWETSGTMLRFRDSTVVPPASLDFGPMELAISDLRYGQKGRARLTARTPMNGTGEIRAEGTLTIDPFVLTADLAAHQVTALPVTPYLRQTMNALIRQGELSFNGRASFASSPFRFGLTGACTLTGFRLAETIGNEDLVRWDRVDLRNLSYRSLPPVLTIEEVVARKPFLRFVIGADRVSNLQRALQMDSSVTAAGGPRVDSSSMTRTRIGKVTVVDGSMRFADLSMNPRFATGIEELNGVIMDLSSDQLARADIDLKGKVDRYAPAVISGQINPLSERAYTDVLFSFHNIELTTFSTYFTRFVGYHVEKGKLSLDLRYRLNNRMLQGENKIVIDQLTLGEAVDGPDVTSLPVKLAIALLKDRNGVIDIDLPVEGSLDDPEFRFGPLIWKALTNVLLKVVTAPFALLGSLFGGGEELNEVHFPAGSDSLLADERGKLDNLAKALEERPALRLDVRGIAVDRIDTRALASSRVNRQLGLRERPNGERKDDLERVRRLYVVTFGTEPSLLLPPPKEGEELPPAGVRDRALLDAAYDRLVDSTTVTEETMRRLASRRAEQIRSYLVTVKQVEPARVFMLDIDAHAPASDGEVRLPLALNAL